MATPIKLDEFGIGTPNLLKRVSPNALDGSNQHKTKRKSRKDKTNYLSTPLLSPKEAVRTAIVSIKTQQRRHRDKRELNRNCIQVNDVPHDGGRGNRAYRNWFNFPEKSISKKQLNNLNETWPHFLENYGKCDRNLSREPLPMCFHGGGLMIPPEAYNESKRMNAVKTYLDKRQWKQTDFFDTLLRPLISTYQVSGLSISLIDRAKQVVKYQIGLPVDSVSRSVSLDGHAILSKDYFIVIDASKDWRMAYNPFVHGPPFIRFYAAVPLLTPEGHAIGAITIFDPYARPQIPKNLVETLTGISKKVSEFINTGPLKGSPRIESASSRDEKSASLVGNVVSRKRKVATYSLLSSEEPFPEFLNPNHRLKFDLRSLKGLKYSHTLVQSYQILNELKDCPDGKSAILKASSTLAESLGLKVVYVVEVRLTSSYETKVSQFPFPTGHKFSMNSKIEDMIRPGRLIGEPAVSINFIGGYNIQGILHTFDNEVHCYALDSDYGVQYSSNA